MKGESLYIQSTYGTERALLRLALDESKQEALLLVFYCVEIPGDKDISKKVDKTPIVTMIFMWLDGLPLTLSLE